MNFKKEKKFKGIKLNDTELTVLLDVRFVIWIITPALF